MAWAAVRYMAVVLLLLTFCLLLLPLWESVIVLFCCALLCVRSGIAIILVGGRGLVALLNLSSWCLVVVERLFLLVPRGCLRFVIVVFPDHTHLLSNSYLGVMQCSFFKQTSCLIINMETKYCTNQTHCL